MASKMFKFGAAMNDCELLVDQQQFRRIAIRQTFSDRILDNY